VFEGHDIDVRPVSHDVGGRALVQSVFPAGLPRLSVERVNVRDAARGSKIASSDDQILDDERITVKLEGLSVLLRVVTPADLARLLPQRSEDPVAGTDERETPRDGRGCEASPAGVVGPEESRLR